MMVVFGLLQGVFAIAVFLALNVLGLVALERVSGRVFKSRDWGRGAWGEWGADKSLRQDR